MADLQAAQADANIVLTKAQAIRQLADAGYDKDSVVAAVASGDLATLKAR